MIHDWDRVYVDTDTQRLGSHVILKFIDNDGKDHEFRLNKTNVKWILKALKRGSKLAKMSNG